MLQQLPSEVLLQIFNYLPPPSLHILARTHPRFSQLTQFLGAYQLDYTRIDTTTQVMAEITEKYIPNDGTGDQIRHLCIIYYSYLPNFIFTIIKQRCPNVVSFDYDPTVLNLTRRQQQQRPWRRHSFVTGTVNNGFWPSVKHLPECHEPCTVKWKKAAPLFQRLETLHISPRHRFFLDSSKQQPSPSSVGARNDYVKLNLPFFPQLNDLTLHVKRHKSKVNPPIIRYIHAQCPRLSTLTLRDIEFRRSFFHFSDSPLFPQRKYSRSFGSGPLDTLKLENVTFEYVYGQGYNPLTTMYPNLRTLFISINDHNQHGLVNGYCTIKQVYGMITRLKHLTKLTVHLNGRDPEHSLCNKWLKHRVEKYYSHSSRQRILVSIIQV